MKIITISILVLLFCTASLHAQITKEQANVIVLQHIQNEATSPYLLYIYNHTPSIEGIFINTYNEETIKVKYACWAYYLNENPETSEPCQHRYLFVKENDGNLLEIITYNDLGIIDFTEWELLSLEVVDREENKSMMIYPNPTTGELRVTSYELQVTSIEVFDIYGRTVSTHYSILTTHYSIDISHLPTGLYFVKVFTENGVFVEKVIKQ
jgi:hypothetical protein